MIREYVSFIKNYLNLVQIKTKYMVIIVISALFYKGFYVLIPLIGSLIIKYLQNNDAEITSICLLLIFFHMFFIILL